MQSWSQTSPECMQPSTVSNESQWTNCDSSVDDDSVKGEALSIGGRNRGDIVP